MYKDKHVINAEELVVKLKDLEKLDVNKALTNSCILVRDDASLNCPVDTGQLKRSLTYDIQENVGVVGTNVFYAPYVEYGTGLFARDGDGRKDVPWRYQTADGSWHSTSGQKPQPYLEPALEKNRQAIVDEFRKTIKEAFK